MTDTPEYATVGQLQSLQAGVDQSLGGHDKDIALANERIDRLEKKLEAATTTGDHQHVPAGHSAESAEVVTGPVAAKAPAPSPDTPPAPQDDDPW